jgi:hypothetical protein
MIHLNWADFYHTVPEFASGKIKLGTLEVHLDEEIEFGVPIGTLSVRALVNIIATTIDPSDTSLWQTTPQLAMLVFIATRRVQALNSYFPLTNSLNKREKQAFYRLAGDIMRQPNFNTFPISWVKPGKHGVLTAANKWRDIKDMKLIEIRDYTSPQAAAIGFFVACHIAEIFFYRQDILERLLNTPFQIRLYTTQYNFKRDGGAGGGNFSLEKGGIQLVLSRLYEGFNDKTPGVAPFLHEFGHLLDHFDAAQGRLSGSHGTLPGMRPDEGKIYVPKARELFVKGKRLEAERYDKLCQQGYTSDTTLPIGHPYVFQNDTEFIAGYFEMFFRNPHYFAQQNPDLYDSFVLTFGQDPRKMWKTDFPFYIQQNQGFYQSGQRPPKHGLTI